METKKFIFHGCFPGSKGGVSGAPVLPTVSFGALFLLHLGVTKCSEFFLNSLRSSATKTVTNKLDVICHGRSTG